MKVLIETIKEGFMLMMATVMIFVIGGTILGLAVRYILYPIWNF